MSVVDWSKAPEGVIGMFSPKTDSPNHQFFVMTKHEKELMGGLCFCGEKQSGDQYHVFAEFWEWHERPATPQWNGEGLPPVGASVEWFSPVYGWLGGRVIGHDGAVAVISHNDGYTGCHPHGVRPIRTPEQLAAEARERAIGEMARIAGAGAAAGLSAFGAIYDHGYRKQEQPE